MLAACSGLPNVLPSSRSHERELPLPEDLAPERAALAFELETFQLPNGLTVVLLEDHGLPEVVVDTWFAVGSKDEAPGQRGFAHLCERLMSVGTARVPGNAFDQLMERGGGANSASTSPDRTRSFSRGPSWLLPTLLWLDAERLAALDEHLSAEMLARQHEIVRTERRRNTENVPYGKVELLLPAALYPPEHPYHHPVIGSPADLEAARLDDVLAFFREFYVPASATLVVAGDFEAREARGLIERTFGTLENRPAPTRARGPEATLASEVRVLAGDRVGGDIQFQKLLLAWHSPAAYGPGDAELELLATILAEGSSSRLDQRLVLDLCLAQEVEASQRSAELGSVFVIEALATPGADLDRIEHEILAVLAELQRDGPSEAELRQASARARARFLGRMESLLARAEAVQAYRRFFGAADGFQRDLERRTGATREDLRDVARAVFAAGRVDLRILPALADDLERERAQHQNDVRADGS